MSVHNFIEDAPLLGVKRSANGYLMAEVRAARTGVQDYAGHELGRPDLERIRVYRPEDAVFNKASMATYAGKPVTNDHPHEMVTADNWKKFAVGQIGNDDIARDGESVRVPVMLMDAAAIQAVESGKRQVSAGYTMALDMLDTVGVTDKGEEYDAVVSDIAINHLAIVQAGRAGPDHRIGDAQPVQWGAVPIDDASPVNSTVPAVSATHHKSEKAMSTRTIVVDGLTVETTDAGAAAIEKLQKDVKTAQDAADAAKAVADSEAKQAKDEHEKAIAERDTALATKDAEIKELKEKALDAAAIDKLVSERAALLDKAGKLAKDADFSGKSVAEIKAIVVDAVNGEGFSKDKSDTYIEVAFDLAKVPEEKVDTVRAVLKDRQPTEVEDHGYSTMKNDLSNAWKQGAKV